MVRNVYGKKPFYESLGGFYGSQWWFDWSQDDLSNDQSNFLGVQMFFSQRPLRWILQKQKRSPSDPNHFLPRPICLLRVHPVYQKLHCQCSKNNQDLINKRIFHAFICFNFIVPFGSELDRFIFVIVIDLSICFSFFIFSVFVTQFKSMCACFA